MTPRPIFVVGYERSGTTLLQAMLGAHPHIAAPPELHYLLRIGELRDYYGDLADDASLRHALHDTLNPPLDILAGCGFDEDVLFEAARPTDRSYRALLQVVMDDFARRHGKARWSEKTPGQTARAV
ncbi:MAG: sulfotransferase, partial [Actinobacteria bacterium]|nr:sulfotransferase [Actinomycetota bacterium]